MVKKLLKYELSYYIKTLMMVLPITLLIGVCNLILSPLKDLDYPLSLLYYLSFTLLYIGVLISTIAPIVISVIRFYKNFYSNEGYLTFSLPVSNHLHLLTKLIASTIASLAGAIVSIITVLIASINGLEVLEVFLDLFRSIMPGLAGLGVINIIFYVIEIIILVLLATFSAPLLYYTCISIGQLGKKNRILLAVLVYYGFTVASQVLFSLLTVFSLVLGVNGLFDGIGQFFTNNPIAAIHIILIVLIILQAGLGTLFYFVNYKIMTHKLNLE